MRAAGNSSVAEALEAALRSESSEPITVADLTEAAGERALVLLLILINLPNVVLAPPVFTGIIAVPTAAFGAQLIAGRRKPWLPEAVLRREVSAPALQRVLAATGPWLRRIEGLGRPRLGAVSRLSFRLLGIFALVASLIVALPLPGTNVLPALSLVVLGIGALRRDGLLVLVGVLIGILGILVTVFAAGIAIELIRWVLASL